MAGLWRIGLLGLCCPAAGLAQEPEANRFSLSGAIALVSDYRFRGISLSNGHAAPQASLTLSHRSGVYATLWSSTLDGFGAVGGADFEVDASVGARLPVAGGTADVGLLYYAYPGSSGGDYEFFEPYLSFSKSFGRLATKVSAAFAPAQNALGGNSNLYLAGDVSGAIPQMPVTLRAHVGRSRGNTPLSPTGDYLEWQLGADIAWRNFLLGISYVETDLNAAEAAAGGATRDIVSSAVVASLSATF